MMVRAASALCSRGPSWLCGGQTASLSPFTAAELAQGREGWSKDPGEDMAGVGLVPR